MAEGGTLRHKPKDETRRRRRRRRRRQRREHDEKLNLRRAHSAAKQRNDGRSAVTASRHSGPRVYKRASPNVQHADTDPHYYL